MQWFTRLFDRTGALGAIIAALGCVACFPALGALAASLGLVVMLTVAVWDIVLPPLKTFSRH